VREFENGMLTFVTVSDESECEAAVRKIGLSQHAHAKYAGVEIDRFFQVANPKHGVEYAHI